MKQVQLTDKTNDKLQAIADKRKQNEELNKFKNGIVQELIDQAYKKEVLK